MCVAVVPDFWLLNSLAFLGSRQNWRMVRIQSFVRQVAVLPLRSAPPCGQKIAVVYCPFRECYVALHAFMW